PIQVALVQPRAISPVIEPYRQTDPPPAKRKFMRQRTKTVSKRTLWRRAAHVQGESLGYGPVVDGRVWRRVLKDLPTSPPPWDPRVVLNQEPEYLELQAITRDLHAGWISGIRQRRMRVIRDVMRAHG